MPGAENSQPNRTELFLHACRGEPVERVPVWLMRQAGRYLPEYRAVRQRHEFLEICKTPELAVEVSLQPFRVLGVDAVIVFSDILIPAEAMGVELEITDAGPVLSNPIRRASQVEALKEFDPEQETRFVGEAIRQLCRALGPQVPVIGFAGAPWTLACYLVGGGAKEGPERCKALMYEQPRLFRRLLEKIARVTAAYLQAHIGAGAAAVQLFDTWAGELGQTTYREFALPATQLLLAELDAGAVPLVLYSKSSAHLLASLAETRADVLSVDWRVDLAKARRQLGSRVALQGNVDPAVLLGPEAGIRAAATEAIEKTGGLGHILNLGHGVLPSTPVEHARAFIHAGQTTLLPARQPMGRAV